MRAPLVVTLITAGVLALTTWAVIPSGIGPEFEAMCNLREGRAMLQEMNESLGRSREFVRSLRGPQVQMEASWYGEPHRNRLTASGEKFDPRGLTCASWDYSLGEILEIEHNGKRVYARVNDRGPAKWTNRGIDLSERIAEILGFKEAGEAVVQVRRIR